MRSKVFSLGMDNSIENEITRNQTHFKSIPEKAIALPVIPDYEGEREGIARFDRNLEPDLFPHQTTTQSVLKIRTQHEKLRAMLLGN